MNKLTLPGLNGYGVLNIDATTSARATQLMRRTATSLWSLSTPYGRLVADPYWYGQALRLLGLRGRYFSVAELAAVIGWPIDGPDLPGLELGAAKRLVPSLQPAIRRPDARRQRLRRRGPASRHHACASTRGSTSSVRLAPARQPPQEPDP